MKIGDLVKHKRNGQLGLVIRIEIAMGGNDPFYHIQWANNSNSACWNDEIEPVDKNWYKKQKST